MTALTTHIEKNHDVSITSSELSFANYDDFLVWKTNEEESSMSCFVQHGGAITSSSMIRYRYLYCNRSGIFESKGKGKRSMKMQQSSKMGAMCTAHIKVEENLQSGSCKIQYYSTHVGHKNEFAHLPIPNKLKQDIAAQIKLGVSVDKIMDKMRDVSGLDTIKRKHLVVRQDVLNIKRLVNLDNVQKHVNDQTSVALWVEEARKFAYNPVLVFKPQGEKAAIVGEVDDLCEDSFLLGLQTEYQRDMMQKFGNNCICMDATHGTTVYDFFLVTVMVLDDYGEGIPVAWAITNSEDTSSLVQFLKPLREQVGEIHPTIFMSDDAEQFFTSWCGVFGLGAKKLLCSWHVDRAWRNAIHEHVPDKQLKLEVYHMLRLLLLELSIEKFHLLLPQVLTFFQERCTRFYEYMTRTYTNRVSQWAACYRVNTQINTNMMVEAFHRVLKIVYLEHKQNRRVDTLLHTLMKINRDACFNSLRKQEFGKQSHRLSEIKKRHVSATKMLEEGNTDIQKSTCDTWKVKVAGRPN